MLKKCKNLKGMNNLVVNCRKLEIFAFNFFQQDYFPQKHRGHDYITTGSLRTARNTKLVIAT